MTEQKDFELNPDDFKTGNWLIDGFNFIQNLHQNLDGVATMTWNMWGIGHDQFRTQIKC